MPITIRFTAEDPAKDGLNWYAYCGGNPVVFVDPTGLYDRELAVKYSQIYSHKRNPNYDDYSSLNGNCANFISQCLYSGAISQTNKWYSTAKPIEQQKKEARKNKFVERRNTSRAWKTANGLYKYFSNSRNGYINGEVVTIKNEEDLKNVLKNNDNDYNIQKGDLIFLTYKDTERAVHSMMVSKVDDELYYAANTNDQDYGKLSKNVNFEEYDVKVVRIKEDA